MNQERPTLGVAVVGFGWMGQVHARAFARLAHHYPGSPLVPRFVVVADPEHSRGEEAQRVYGFADAVTDWREVMTRDDVDVVSICGPNFVHRDIAVAAAQSGKHVWVEKPAGRNLAETTEIATAVEEACVRSAVGFNYRNAPALEAARDLIAAGEIGELEAVSVQFFSDYAAHPDGALSWRFDPEFSGSGVLGDLGSHAFDLARYVVQGAAGDVTELVADTATFIPTRPIASGPVSHFSIGSGGERGPVENEDHVEALLRFGSGLRGNLRASRVAVGEQCRYAIEVRGTKGAVAWDFRRMQELQVCRTADYQNAGWSTEFMGPGRGELGAFQPGAGTTMGYDDLKVIECERLVRGIHLGEDVGATIADAVWSARFVDAVFRSETTGAWAKV